MLTLYCHTGASLNDRATLKALVGVSMDIPQEPSLHGFFFLFEPASPRGIHGDVSWVVSTPMSPGPVSLHLLALQLKPSLSGLGVKGSARQGWVVD